MPIYHQLGTVPRKRHSVFRGAGGALLSEELIGNHGFQGPASLVYHLRRPTAVLGVRSAWETPWETAPDHRLQHRHFRTGRLVTGHSPTMDRFPLLFNSQVAISYATPREEDAFFYRNAQGDEVVYVSSGEGTLETALGSIPFRAGDYLVIPRGILHRYRLGTGPHRFLIVESEGYVRTPAHYRNEHGQLLEIAPYSERDIRRPADLETHDETGRFRLLVKKNNHVTEYELAHHPFDVVGWDGYYYPWALSIHDFEPRVGRFHLPPPVHQTFAGDGFVICSFCPRPHDFDPEAVPIPYNHSNVMADEVIYYANASFSSRRGIEYGSITLHPDGIPHGPHPGRVEASLGSRQTDELAVMIDTMRPLRISTHAMGIEDPDYCRSWLE